RLAVDMESIVRDGVEARKGLARLRLASLQILVEHLFPAGAVDAGRGGDDAVEVEQDGIVVLAGDHTWMAHSVILRHCKRGPPAARFCTQLIVAQSSAA